MFTGEQILDVLQEVGITHVVMVPDGTLGRWQETIAGAATPHLINVCREGEAWGVAAGLELGGARPLVIIQCTGLFESGDALRNTVYDWGLPLFAIIGYRSYLSQEFLPGDTCLEFTEPVLAAWKLDSVFVKQPEQLEEIATHYRACRDARKAGAILLAEGRS